MHMREPRCLSRESRCQQATYWSMSLVASDLPAPDSPEMMIDWSVRSESMPRYDSSATWIQQRRQP